MALFRIPGMTIGEEIGQGAESIVYRAWKEKQQYAIKLHRAFKPEELKDATLKLKKEAAFVARLKHPGLTSIWEVGEFEGRSYLVMEYAEGDPLSVAIESKQLTENDVIHIAKTLAGALSEVHRFGLIHRDVKPQNIVYSKIQDKINIKLIDFGFAQQTKKDEKPEQIVGTLLYSSPEQSGMLKRPVDGRADIYSLGIVLYECLVGQVPFYSKDIGELLHQHATASAKNVCEINSSISPVLGLIVAKLLAKDPDDRYQTGESLVSDLNNLNKLTELFNVGEEVLLGQQFFQPEELYEIPLIGREKEVERLQKAWREVNKSEGSIIVVEGQPGTGKSRLLRELLDSAKKEKTLILSAKCAFSDPIPFSSIRNSIDAYLRRIKLLPQVERKKEEERIKAAAGEYSGILRNFSPNLSLILSDSIKSSPNSDSHDIFYTAISSFLINLSRNEPMIIYIDDVQWLDDASRNVLKKISEKIKEHKLLLATTARNDSDSVNGLNRFVNEMGTSVSLRLTTNPLAGDSVRRLVLAHLQGELEPSFLKQLENRTSGNPFVIGEYIRAILDSGLLRPSWGKWIVDTEGLERIQLSNDVIQLVLKRTEFLEETTIQTLSAAALLGNRFSLELLPSICDREIGVINAAVAQSIQERLVERTEASEYAFVHDRVQEAFLARLNESSKQEIHQKIAETLEIKPLDSADFEIKLAQHYNFGQTNKNPKRVYQANIAAGVRAKENYADEEAYQFFQNALKVSQVIQETPAPSFYEALGEVCARTARFDEAISALLLAIQQTPNKLQRARIRTRIIMIQSTNMNIPQAWKESKIALAEAGSPWPLFTVIALFKAIGYFIASLFVRITGIGFGTVKGPTREKYIILAKVYESALYPAYFLANDITFLILTMSPLYMANRLGPSKEYAYLYGNFALVLGVLKLKSAALFYAQTAINLAEQLGDQYLLVRQKLQLGWVYHFLGEVTESEAKQSINMEELGRWMDPNDYMKGCLDLADNLQMRGYAQEAAVWVEKAIKRSNNEHHYYNCFNSVLSTIGRPKDAAQGLQRSKLIVDALPNKFICGEWGAHSLYHYMEQEEYGAALIDEAVNLFKKEKFVPFRALIDLRLFYIYHAHIRLQQTIIASPYERPAALKVFGSAVFDLMLASVVGSTHEPHIKSHYLFMRAAQAWLKKNNKKATNLLAKAEALAQQADSPWVIFEVHRLRAQMLIEQGYTIPAMREVRYCASLAMQHGWSSRLQKLQREFGLSQAATSAINASMSITASIAPMGLSSASLGANFSRTNQDTRTATTSSGPSVFQLQRQLESLLSVSIASSNILDPELQSKVSLDEIIRILGAERAYLFLLEGEEDLVLKTGRNMEKQDIALEAYSSTVIEQVRKTRQPIVFSGNEAGQISISESVVAHNLRSIMVAPLIRQDKLIGVIYLDNRLARGVFTENDLQLLSALSSYISIAIETVRVAQLEKERTLLEKDLAVTAAVQSLILPRQSDVSFKDVNISGFYRPASQSGGDWWWYETKPDGRVWILLGDVTGHGVGSAMVTTAVASSYRILRQNKLNDNPGTLLNALNADFKELCGDLYQMVFSAIEIDPAKNLLRWWSAGGLPILILRKSGKVDALNLKGTPLGSSPFELGSISSPFAPGDRVFAFSDGVTETETTKGGQFGLRRTKDFLVNSSTQSTKQAKENFIKALDEIRGDQPQEDDITFILLDRV